MVKIYETGGSSAATAWPAYTQHCKILLWDIQFLGPKSWCRFWTDEVQAYISYHKL